MHININIGVGTRGEGGPFSTNIKSVGEGTEVLKCVLLHRNTPALIVFDNCRKNRIHTRHSPFLILKTIP